ncbi:hypothetical protein [Emcibacter sp.]|uniref:hypothetical protein n=1 Tax=Emcibacter sp. TaxID=1979954 RepID=UPI002AA6A3EE|nr:hypothetical protein [Emcibacter sp.]
MSTTPVQYPFQALEDCSRNSGSAAFADTFSSLLEEVLGVEQCLLFALPDNRAEDFAALACLLSLNFNPDNTAPALASAYLQGSLQKDTNLTLLETAPSDHWQVLPFRELTVSTSNAGNKYDRVSLIRRDGRTFYYFILYCRNDGDQSGIATSGLPAMVGSMLLSHIRHADPGLVIDPVSFLPTPLRNYCATLLKQAESAKADNLVGTDENPLWQDASHRLGIRSLEELVRLCH